MTIYSIIACIAPWAIWKSKKIWHQNISSPVGRCPLCYWRVWRSITNSPRKNEAAGLKQKWVSCGYVWWWKPNAVKNNIVLGYGMLGSQYKLLNFQRRIQICKKDSPVLMLSYTILDNTVIVDFTWYALICFRWQPISPIGFCHFCMDCHVNLWPIIFCIFILKKFIKFLCVTSSIPIRYKITSKLNII